MRRIVSLWLPRFPIERLLREGPSPARPGQPLALVLPGAGGVRLAACDERALAAGLMPGERLADARARLPHLATALAEPERDARALLKLAAWAERWTPWVAPDPPDGLLLDVTGVAHLFGGEEAMLAAMVRAFSGLGFGVRPALAGNEAAAWALARHGSTACPVVPPGGEEAALAPLPVAALRLDPDTARTLRRLGLKTVGSLLGLPRASLRRRFRSPVPAEALLSRLDASLGRTQAPLSPLKAPPAFVARRALAEPLVTPEGMALLLDRLAGDLAEALERAGQGAVRLELALYRVDGSRAVVPAGLARPSRDALHLARLLAPRLERLDLGFGVDAATLAAGVAAPLAAEQSDCLGGRETRSLAELADRVSSRFEGHGLARLDPFDSHLPERAEREAPWAGVGLQPHPEDRDRPRPLLLFDRPEAVSVIAEVPEGPPRRFTWRRVGRRVVRADGPERIAAEWWRGDALSRDYYVVEDEAGRRYWLYRLGRYGGPAPAWFVHGLFP